MDDIKRVQLSEIAELITKGTTPTTLGYEFQDNGINFLKIECFDEKGDFIKDKVTHISEECHEKLKRSQLKDGDILFSIAGAIGRVAIVTEEMLPANTNQALAIIRISDEEVYLPYIKLILTSPIVKEQFEKKKQGVAQLNLSLKDINEISIPLPNREKQIELTKLFEKVAGVIAKRNKEIKSLDDLIKARFVEMFGEYEYTTTIARYVAELRGGKSLAGTEICENRVLKTGAATFGWFDPEQYKYLPVDYEPLPEHKVETGDVIISRMNTPELVGACSYVFKAPDNMYYPDRLWKTIPTEDTNPIFLWQLLWDPEIRRIIKEKSGGTSGTMHNISKPKLLEIKCIDVPLDLQNEFGDFVLQVDKSKFLRSIYCDRLHIFMEQIKTILTPIGNYCFCRN